MIELRNVTKKFGRNVAVNDLTLAVPAGEIFGLLGHNGAGKSTAIGMMLGRSGPPRGRSRSAATRSPTTASAPCKRSAPFLNPRPSTTT